LLIRPERVKLIENGSGLKGRVADVIFQKTRFRITLANGLYFYSSKVLEVGDELSFSVEAECLGR